jgi:phage recombination protein Bet
MTTPTKTNAVATTKPSAINLMASRLSVEPTKLFETLKATVFQKATNEELLALVVVANEFGLNPFLKELYAFPAKGGGIVPIVSVDGWNKMLVRQPDFDGIEFEFLDDEAGNPVSCTATIHTKNRSHPTKITEYLAECKRNTDPWNNMPRRMLRNRTLCQASRVAFGFSGVKHEEETEAIAIEATIVSTSPATLPPKEVKPAEGKTPQAELEALVVTAGFTFDALQKWGIGSGNIEGADSMASFSEVPTDVCRRLLRAPAGLLKGLELGKE